MRWFIPQGLPGGAGKGDGGSERRLPILTSGWLREGAVNRQETVRGLFPARAFCRIIAPAMSG